MHFELKSISEQSIPDALAKVERYRLLNEPSLAESICLDILAIVPDHQQALISLLLARTDQFHSNAQAKGAQEVLAQIKGDYEQAYYARHHLGAFGKCSHSPWRTGGWRFRISRSAGCNGSLREGHEFCATRKRRCHSAMEHLRARDHAESGDPAVPENEPAQAWGATKPAPESRTLSLR